MVARAWSSGACSAAAPAPDLVFASPAPPFTRPIEGKQGVITYDPIWQCSTRVPRVAKGATCKETPKGGGEKFIPNTSHKSTNNGGSGLVKRRTFGTRAGT